MKKTIIRTLSIALTALLLCAALPLSATAAETYTVTLIGDAVNGVAGTGGGTYAPGETVYIGGTSSIPAGYIFSSWSAVGITLEDPAAANFSFTMPANDVTLTATRVAATGGLHAIYVSGGTASKYSAVSGEVITIKANPAPAGQQFYRWNTQVGATSISSRSTETATFTMGANFVVIEAEYRVIPVYRTVTIINGTASSATATEGTTILIQANEPPAGQVFDKWTTSSPGVSVVVNTSMNSSFRMPGNDVTLTATYKPEGGGNTNPAKYIRLWGKQTGYVSNFWN